MIVQDVAVATTVEVRVEVAGTEVDVLTAVFVGMIGVVEGTPVVAVEVFTGMVLVRVAVPVKTGVLVPGVGQLPPPPGIPVMVNV
jgi:hypothetical protein